ncbi:amidohydrolase family protein [Kineosporia babensis]|uniref:Amidohydrolase family protein n=1 Tax=Kineosporia babensis TaxID=499548 RepID=A0A9X1NC72_9ACTN|nr:amidohydrolase family protein [Kineosporia babensis]
MTPDLVIRNGRVVTSGSEAMADVAVKDGVITQVGGDIPRGHEEIDAAGKLVLPGGMDLHVHLSPVNLPDRQLAWADDYTSGTEAAAAGGVTTIGDITFPIPGESLPQAFDRAVETASAQTVVDFALHTVLLDPSADKLPEIAQLRERGARSLKIFMHLFGFETRAAEYLRVLAQAGHDDMLSLVHCEDSCVIGHELEKLVKAGDTGIENFPRMRPVSSESAAVERAIAFAESADAPIYIVHLSSARALDAATSARRRGLPVYVETRPIYLLFDESRYQSDTPGLYVGNPPLRSRSDVDALWAGLAAGDIATCCTDHAPWKREQKLAPEVDVTMTRPGMADLETLMPALFSEGVLKGRISLQRFVEATSTNAARLFGLYPRKGTIAPGADADITIFDPHLTKPVRGAELYSRAKMSLLEGVELTGWPVRTISRGETVMLDGEVLGKPGRGRLAQPTDTPAFASPQAPIL